LSQNLLEKPALILAAGNPSRGDDALGPEFIRLIKNKKSKVMNYCDTLLEFQLQIENIIDLENYRQILFVDADVSLRYPFKVRTLIPEKDTSYSSHALSPEALLFTFQETLGKVPPSTYALSIRGYDFELGEKISQKAKSNLLQAVGKFSQLSANRDGLLNFEFLKI